jgi:hypothetical protein
VVSCTPHPLSSRNDMIGNMEAVYNVSPACITKVGRRQIGFVGLGRGGGGSTKLNFIHRGTEIHHQSKAP